MENHFSVDEIAIIDEINNILYDRLGQDFDTIENVQSEIEKALSIVFAEYSFVPELDDYKVDVTNEDIKPYETLSIIVPITSPHGNEYDMNISVYNDADVNKFVLDVQIQYPWESYMDIDDYDYDDDDLPDEDESEDDDNGKGDNHISRYL